MVDLDSADDLRVYNLRVGVDLSLVDDGEDFERFPSFDLLAGGLPPLAPLLSSLARQTECLARR